MFDFNKLVDNHIKREHKPKGIGRYYPSEIGSCLRKVWYSYKFPQEVEPDLLKVFEVGNIMHDFVARVLKDKRNDGIELLEAELPFQLQMKNFIISGRIDDLILIKAGDTKVLVEVKSTSNISKQTEPKAQHRLQLQLYMMAMKIYDGVLLYIDKRNLQSKVFTIPYDEAEAVLALERFHMLHDALSDDSIPNPEAKMESSMNWMCNYCEYRDRCDKDGGPDDDD
jgi:CRISPR-associated exonuclease Cas4